MRRLLERSFHLYRGRKQDIVLQVDVLVQVRFKFGQRLVQGAVAGAGNLYELLNNGHIGKWPGPTCSGSSCPGWTLLDNNALGAAIVAWGNNLYRIAGLGGLPLKLGAHLRHIGYS